MTDLVLASGSPRRSEMLKQMGLEFSVHVSDIDETRKEKELPEDYVVRLAREKALAVKKITPDFGEQTAILAADTIVVQGDRVYGKPRDYEHAQRIWRALSATKHQVITAVSLLVGDSVQVKVSVTDVDFVVINEEQMQRYWATGEPSDKAGAYAIQGFASAWVKQIQGSYSNVVGLPLREVNQLLTSVQLNWL